MQKDLPQRPVLRTLPDDMKRALPIVLVVVLLVVAGSAALAWRSLTTPVLASPASETIILEIRPGASLRQVSRDLEAQGLVAFAPLVEGYARLSGYAARLQAGRYALDRSMTPVEMVDTIVSGDAVFDELTLTIPEGWSLNDIENYFEAIGLFSKERFQEAAVMQDRYRGYPLLVDLPDDSILDGYLFPDTYRVFPDSTPESIVARMIDNFHRRIPESLLAMIMAQERTLHEVLTLASIVQKESAGDSEMPEVAGVFWNRLQIGMRLESDATVNYILGTNKLQPTFADTEVQHPYNTYENAGLPPGPIGNPGLPAIRAAAEPAEHDFLFFLHRPSREIVMSRTFAEHLENKARYLD